MRSLLLYLLAVVLPPVAVFLCGGTPSQLVLNVCLWLFGCIPGVVHAVVVVGKYNARAASPQLRL